MDSRHERQKLIKLCLTFSSVPSSLFMQVQTDLRPQLEEQHGPSLLGTQCAPYEPANGNFHHGEAKPPYLTGPAQSYTATKEGYRRLWEGTAEHQAWGNGSLQGLSSGSCCNQKEWAESRKDEHGQTPAWLDSKAWKRCISPSRVKL